MALRLRRGTDAERQLITPVEGELIYTTDLKELWIGDGTIVGGTKVTGAIPDTLTDLSNVDAGVPQVGEILSWDGNNWVPISNEGVTEGSNYRINITSQDSTVILDSDTSTFTGNFVGDVIGDTAGTHTGSVIGDLTGTVTGDVIGTLDGDVTGSVFADDSTLVIDGITGNINASSGIVLSGALEAFDGESLVLESNIVGSTMSITGVTSGLFGTESSVTIDAVKGSLTTPQDTVASDIISAVKVRGYNNGDYVLGSVQQTFWEADADFGETYPKSGWRLAANAGDGKGTLLREDGITPSGFNHMTLRGNGVLEGPIFKMNVVADSTARDALITAPEAGMTVFVTDGDGAGNPKFQGYDGSAWVNLN